MKISNKEAIRILRKWDINWTPEYRGFTCGGCGRTVRKAWHIHCRDHEFKRELHLCNQCGKKYETN